jgi:hypothetical protein
MRPSSSIFTASAFAVRRSEDLQVAWLDAADDAYEAYLAWRDADRDELTEAFVVYQAALDREEAAARALQMETARLPPRIR